MNDVRFLGGILCLEEVPLTLLNDYVASQAYI
jgi:hypothetical protein